MNERIKELAVAAQVEHCISHVRLKEFSDLIIQEAISVVQKRFMGDNNREDMEVLRCVEDLKKHFGVE
jgi:hypothetical protein